MRFLLDAESGAGVCSFVCAACSAAPSILAISKSSKSSALKTGCFFFAGETPMLCGCFLGERLG